MHYAGFWRRFGALWLDFIVLLPLTLLVLWVSRYYRLFNVYFFIPQWTISLYYSVYLVRRFGGTPGKLLVGIRIRRVDGSSIGYREAILRYLPEAFLSLLVSIALLLPLFAMTDAEYLSLGFLERSKRLVELAPMWYRPTNIALGIWFWSEFIVMLTNRKRRALHDFVAGTVVVRDASVQLAPGAETKSLWARELGG